MRSEQWTPITGVPYDVSNLGRVRSQQSGRVMKHKRDGSYTLCHNNTKTYVTVKKLLRTYWHYEWIHQLEDGEVAKPVTDHPGYYVTSHARVWSSWSQDWLSVHPFRSRRVPNSYHHQVHLPGKTVFLHTLVGRHHLSDWRPGLCVCHTDESLPHPQINSVDNLWVGTHAQNIQDAYDKNRVGG